MTAIDWIIVGFTLAMAFWGYAQGLIVGALSLAGFAGGAILGARLGPLLLNEGAESPYAPLVSLICAAVIGGIFASGLEILGFHLRRRMGDRLGALDGIGGAVLLGCLALGIAWIAGAVALHTPGARDLRDDVQRSEILQRLNAALPPSGAILNALARFDPLPEISGPAPRVAPPNSKIARDPQVQAAAESVVRVLGTACGLGVQGSGWVAGDGVIVTNAHVVAGQEDTTVQLEGGGDAPRRRRRPLRRGQRHRGAPLLGGVRDARAVDERGRQSGHVGRRSSASPRTAATTCSPVAWAEPLRR